MGTKMNMQDSSERFDFEHLLETLLERHKDKDVDPDAVAETFRNALSVKLLTNSLAEIFRVSPSTVEEDLKELGMADLIIRERLRRGPTHPQSSAAQSEFRVCETSNSLKPFEHLFSVKATPDFLEPVPISSDLSKEYSDLFPSVIAKLSNDPFLDFYRKGVLKYVDEYLSGLALQMDEYVRDCFAGRHLQYLVTTGIGANEQFTHFAASMNNQDESRRLIWIPVNSPKRLSLLPDDATVDNTLFMEFSRSSVTEETVKIHEYTPREAHRIVFCNQGPLLKIGKRDKNLIQHLPDQVPGRYGRNKTPILLAPMYVAGMDVKTFWNDTEMAIKAFDLSNPESLPVVVAKYLFVHQRQNDRNLMYLACNDDDLLLLGDQFLQFWNEGVNKDGNDLMLSRFFGLPRDSHMNIEGLLGNHDTKIALFLLRTNMRGTVSHPLVSQKIDAVNPAHDGLSLGDEEVILSYANYSRFSQLMPTVAFEIPNTPSLKLGAVLGQLFADVTFVYSRFSGMDPGYNPEVKAVRERSASLLASAAAKIREGRPIQQALAD